MNQGRTALAPAVCSAGGIVLGTLTAVSTMDRELPTQMLGPALLALSILLADMLSARAQGLAQRRPSGTALFLALTSFAALLITALGNADMLPMMLPIIGGGFGSPLLTARKKRVKPRTEDPA